MEEYNTWKELKFVGVSRYKDTGEFAGFAMTKKKSWTRETAEELAKGWCESETSHTTVEITDDPLILEIAIFHKIEEEKAKNIIIQERDRKLEDIESCISMLEDISSFYDEDKSMF